MKHIYILIAFMFNVVLSFGQQTTNDNLRNKTIGNGLLLKVEDCIGDSMNNTVTVFFSITNYQLPNQKIQIEIDNKYPAMAFDANGNKYFHNKIMLAGITSDNTVSTQIPTNVSIWGCITYFNVYPSANNLNLVTFPIASSNWIGNQPLKNEWLEIKNVPVIWNISKAPNYNSQAATMQYLQTGSLKKLNNGLDFTFIKCEGDVSTQLVTVYFTINNPAKANLKVKIDPWANEQAILIDAKGNSFTFHNASLSNNINSGQVETDLPTGVLIKGSISFRNMLPANTAIALLNIPLAWKYVTEPNYYDVDEGNVQLRNIQINWNTDKTISNSTYPYLVKNIDNGIQMFITGCKGDMGSQTATVYYAFYNKSNPVQKLNINPWNYGKSNAIDEQGTNYSFSKNYLAQTISNGMIEKILPSNLLLSGAMSFKNVLPAASKFSLVNLPITISNWKGGENVFNSLVQLRDLKIDWENKTQVLSNKDLSIAIKRDATIDDDEQYKKTKKLVSGVDFIFTECQGDAASQTVTIFFKILNPGKAHQKVNIDPWWGTYARAIDENGNDYKFGNLNLGRQYGNGYLKAELPSGLFVNGFITFNEVEASSNYLNLVNIPIYSKNRLDNNEKDYEIIELKNVKINWQ